MKNIINLKVYCIYAGERINYIPPLAGILFVYTKIKIVRNVLVQPLETSEKNCYSSLTQIQYCENLKAIAKELAKDATGNIRNDIAFAYILSDIDADFTTALAIAYNLPITSSQTNVESYELKIDFISEEDKSNQYSGKLLDSTVTDIDF